MPALRPVIAREEQNQQRHFVDVGEFGPVQRLCNGILALQVLVGVPLLRGAYKTSALVNDC